eukprot:10367145-Karenia_brevis.AAC.1
MKQAEEALQKLKQEKDAEVEKFQKYSRDIQAALDATQEQQHQVDLGIATRLSPPGVTGQPQVQVTPEMAAQLHQNL